MSSKTNYKTILQSFARRAPVGLQPLPGQVPNDASGFVYAVDHWQRLERFLMIGSDSGTFYVGAQELTRRNAAVVETCLAADAKRTIATIVAVSQAGRASSNDPALIALALAAAAEDPSVRRQALEALPQVARTGSHLLHFADYVNGFRGWGRSLRRAVGDWFLDQPAERLALQAVKYRQRDGWALRDLLRLAHPKPTASDQVALIDWIAHGDNPAAVTRAREVSPLAEGLARLRAAGSTEEAAEIILRHSLPREAVPTELLGERAIWDALLVDMPMTALLRNLAKMSAVGLLTPGSAAAAHVAERLADQEALRAARVHPIALLLALRTYARGKGILGKLAWTPVPSLVTALDAAFDRAFGQLEGSGKRVLVAVDVSGSMSWPTAGSPVLSAAEAAAAMALLFVRTEREPIVVSFDTKVRQEALTPGQRLDDVMAKLANRWGGTDVAQPILYALRERLEVDAFVLLTDQETWAGQRHAQEALADYRAKVNPAARIACLSTAANHGQVVDPEDPLAFGAAGFDAAVPRLLADFLASDIRMS